MVCRGSGRAGDWLARLDRHWFRIAALALFAIAVGQWIQSDPPEHTGPFVVLLNARALAGLVIIAPCTSPHG